MLERKFKQYQKMMKDDLLSDDIKASVTNAMYEEFGTGKADAFMEKLEAGKYDEGFTGQEIILDAEDMKGVDFTPIMTQEGKSR